MVTFVEMEIRGGKVNALREYLAYLSGFCEFVLYYHAFAYYITCCCNGVTIAQLNVCGCRRRHLEKVLSVLDRVAVGGADSVRKQVIYLAKSPKSAILREKSDLRR
jgi:hypothetical protein